jgi:regulator of RNase E activity RraA
MDTTSHYRELFFSFSTPQVSDALEPFGVVSGLSGIRPSVPGRKLFGPAFTVAKEINHDPNYLEAADFLDGVPSGQVVVIDNLGLETSTCWGGILTHYARKKGLNGTVINGLNRDIDEIRNLDYPVFSRGSFMVTGKGRTRLKDVNVPLIIQGVTISPGDFLLGDDNGVVVIPASLLGEVAERAEAIRVVEDGIVDLVVCGDNSLREAREQLKYSELTRAAPAPSKNDGNLGRN